jgi:NADH dehydrogenase
VGHGHRHQGRTQHRVSRRAQPSPFRFIGFGEVATFARGRSVGLLYGVPLLGWIGYAARQSVFLWFIPSRVNALRIVRSFSLNARAR